jgi:hypothetical protein
VAWARWLSGWLIYLVRKKVFLGLAILTTYKTTIHTLYQAFRGETGWLSVGETFLAESGSKYLGSAKHIGQGVSELVEFVSTSGFCGKLGSFGLVRDALFHIWQGVAAVYMLLFLYELYRGRWQKADVDKWEQLLVVTILFLVIAVVQGTGVLQSLIDQVLHLSDTLVFLPREGYADG